MEGFVDHADFYARGPYRSFMRECRLVGSKPTMAFLAEQPAGNYPDPAFPNALLYLSLKGASEAVFDWGAGRWQGRWRSGDLTLVPPQSRSDVTLSERHSFLAICLPDDLAGDQMPCDSLFAAPFRDELTAELCRTLWAEAESTDPHGQLFVDHAIDCLIARLGALGRNRARHDRRSKLSARVMRELGEYVDAHCVRNLAIAELAGIAGCRSSRFNELFRNTTGMSPYRFVITTRLERARRLLASDGSRSVSEIAIDCGFSSQSHLTDAYRNSFGETPGQTRRRAFGRK